MVVLVVFRREHEPPPPFRVEQGESLRALSPTARCVERRAAEDGSVWELGRPPLLGDLHAFGTCDLGYLPLASGTALSSTCTLFNSLERCMLHVSDV